MATYKSVSAILVSPTNPKAVAVVDVAFGGILIDLLSPFYCNRGSDYII